MAIDGFEWGAPDTPGNVAAFGYARAGEDRSAFPKARVVTISQCGSHAVADAEIGGIAGKGSGEQSLARKLYRRPEEDWLLIADNFYNWQDWQDWQAAAGTGAQLLWRVKADLSLPVVRILPDGQDPPQHLVPDADPVFGCVAAAVDERRPSLAGSSRSERSGSNLGPSAVLACRELARVARRVRSDARTYRPGSSGRRPDFVRSEHGG